MWQVSKQRPVCGYFWLFSQNIQTNLDWKYKNDRSRGKCFLAWQKTAREKWKEVCFLINAHFYIIHKLEKLLFTGILRSSRSENFGKFLATHPWRRTILVSYCSAPCIAPDIPSTRIKILLSSSKLYFYVPALTPTAHVFWQRSYSSSFHNFIKIGLNHRFFLENFSEFSEHLFFDNISKRILLNLQHAG